MKSDATIDAFITNFPDEVQTILEKIRRTIQNAAPDATEKISYGIPTFSYKGKNLVHFSGYAKHIGFYPGDEAIEVFKKELSAYKGAKGSVQFPLDKPIPYALIEKITLYRVEKLS
jgi:uncharacterized protein YdhG (YjbR/CyaY superfamily)